MSISTTLSRPDAIPPPQAKACLSSTVAGAVFRTAQARPFTRLKLIAAVAAVLLGTVVGLVRIRGAGAFNTIWAEDGNHFINDALNRSLLDALTKPINGYFLTLPRIIAEFAVRVPLEWAPAVVSLGAAGVTAIYALLVYIASGAHFSTVLPRLMVSVPVVVTHVSILTVPNNIATLQFASLYVMFWMLLWVPATRVGRVVAVMMTLLVGFTTILTVALLPLALLRLYAVRDRRSLTIFGATAIPIALQGLALTIGVSSREGLSHPRWDPIWAFLEYVLWAFPYSVLGERWLMPPGIGMNTRHDAGVPTFDIAEHNALLVLAWMITIGIIVVAARRITRPAWGLASVAIVCSVGVFSLELMAMGFPGDAYLIEEIYLLGVERYLLAPGLMAVTALTALLRPHAGERPEGASAHPWPIVAYATLLVVVCTSGLRTDSPRSMTRPWSEAVAETRAECETSGGHQANLYYGAKVWYPWIVVPCSKLIK